RWNAPEAESKPRQDAAQHRPLSGSVFATRQFPARPHEVAGIAVRIMFEVILVFGFGFPEVAGGRQFRHHLAGPRARQLHNPKIAPVLVSSPRRLRHARTSIHPKPSYNDGFGWMEVRAWRSLRGDETRTGAIFGLCS